MAGGLPEWPGPSEMEEASVPTPPLLPPLPQYSNLLCI